MRFSEATALTAADIDADAKTCRINKAWKYSGDYRPEIGRPKTKKSIRTISLPPAALEVVDLTASGLPVHQWRRQSRSRTGCGREGIRSARHTRGTGPTAKVELPLGLPGLPFGVAGWRVWRPQVWRGVRQETPQRRDGAGASHRPRFERCMESLAGAGTYECWR
jgi:hypothetical protein